MVMGNEHTRSVLVAKVSGFDGVVNARTSAHRDQYRQCFEFDISDATVKFTHNHDYSETQLQTGTRLKQESQKTRLDQRRRARLGESWLAFWEHWKPLMKANPFHNRSKASLVETTAAKRGQPFDNNKSIVETPQSRWLGLSRYLKDDEDGRLEQERWKAIEYGRFETIIDSPKITINFFWDVPGYVSEDTGATSPYSADINGDVPPAYGLELELGGGLMNYGPWADRQRANLQAVFFPASYATLEAAKRLEPGQARVSTKFKIVITLLKPVTLRVHTREESKDWRWKNHLDKVQSSKTKRKFKSKKGDTPAPDPETRPAGWLDLTVGANTCVTYSMDMVAGPSGYQNWLKMDLKPIQMSTSVNHDLMWRCNGASMACSLPNPLAWNALRHWRFDIRIHEFELFIIRDHAFLITDLINDWTSGPPGEFFAFVPFVYSLRLSMPNFKLYLNANDANIIDNPTSLDDNAFIMLWLNELTADIGIPMKTFRPAKNSVTFDVDTAPGGLRLTTPMWSTQRSFLKSDTVGSFEGISVKGSYNYYTSTSPTLTDTVLLDVRGNAPSIFLYGFLIRYFMNFKDNYFGDDLHFQTQEEYQQQIGPSGDHKITGRDEHSHTKLSNDLDVILTISADNSSIFAPSNIYSASENIRVDLVSFASDLRFTNYYMDLQVDFSPLALTRGYIDTQEGRGVPADSSTQAFVDGLSVSGHRLFGLPPAEPTYVCNWDFEVGKISGECSVDFLTNVVGTARSFAFSFLDAENALPRRNPVVLHDITFLRATVHPIKLWLHVDSSAFLFEADTISMNLNDWAGDRFSERLHLSIPRFCLACIDSRSAARHRTTIDAKVPTYGYVGSSVDVRMVETKSSFEDQRRLQQDHVALHDSRTHRTPWLLHDHGSLGASIHHDFQNKTRPPASPFPPMPEPLKDLDPRISFTSSSQSHRSHSSKRSSRGRSSFISVDTANSSHAKNSPDRHNFSTRPRPAEPSKASQRARLPAMGNETIEGMPPSSMTFSSAFETPYFPLQYIEPNTSDVPSCPSSSISGGDDQVQPNENMDPSRNVSSKCTTILIRMENGLRALCTPEALFHINSLVSSLQAGAPEDLLDELQTGVMSETVSKNKPSAAPTMFELRAVLPSMAVRLQSQASNYSNSLERRMYDLTLGDLVATARKYPVTGNNARESTSHSTLHLTLGNASFIATGAVSSSIQSQARIEASLNRAILWLIQGDNVDGGIQYNQLRFVNSNRKIEQLASLVNSTLALGDSLVNSFSVTASSHRNRLQALVYLLSTFSESIKDPAFLTSTSYTVRTSSVHPRNDDSWKLISRLRHVFNRSSTEQQIALLKDCSSMKIQYLHDIRQRVVADLNKWRSWDLEDVNSSHLLNLVFGRLPGRAHISSTATTPARFCLRSGFTQLLIDPGPKQNEFSVENVVAAIKAKPSDLSHEGNSLAPHPQWTLQLSVARTRLFLNWGICELLESILKQYLEAPALSVPVARGNDVERQLSSVPLTVHAAAAFEEICTSFETINFKASSRCSGLASSVVIKKASSDTDLITGIANTATLVSDISGLHQQIIQCTLIQPSLHGGLESRQMKGRALNIWKVGGFCQELETNIHEDALGLLGVADVFIRDEMAYVKRIDEEILDKLRKFSRKPINSAQKIKSSHSFHVALLLQNYTISIKLLSSLTYNMKGKTARSTLRSRDVSETKLALDFDVDDHEHSFINRGGHTDHQVFHMTLPPVNGQWLLTRARDVISISASVAIRKIHIHASEIHALFTTLSRGEIVTFRNNVIRDMTLVKSNWRTASWPKAEVSASRVASSQSNTVFLYNARVTIAGLNVKASSSRSSKLSADLSLDVGDFHADLNNESAEQEVLTYPEIGASLQHVAILLKRSDMTESYPCGDLAFTASFIGTSRLNDERKLTRSFEISTDEFEINLYPETASSIADIIGYLQQRFKSFNLSEEINTFRARRLRSKSHATPHLGPQSDVAETYEHPASLFSSMYSLEVNYIQLVWHVGDTAPISPGHEVENLVFSLAKVDLTTRKANSARLMLKDLQLQMVPSSQSTRVRTMNSALLPEVVFNVAYLSTAKDRRLAFQAVGRTLDLRLTSQFMLPASDLQKSIGIATEELRKVIADWNAAFIRDEQQSKTILGNKTLSSVLVDVDFAGAEVHIQGTKNDPQAILSNALEAADRNSVGQIRERPKGTDRSIVLSAPGVAFKVEYQNLIVEDPSLNAEVKVNASSNTLHPAVVPLILEMSESVKTIVGDKSKQALADDAHASPSKFGKQEQLDSANPTAILGNCRLNIGLRICKQDFGLTCQPIARVAATAKFEDIYITVNTVQAADQHRFFALAAVITSLESSVQHVYSREKTGSFSLESINLSLMNSRHISETEGLSAILKLSPMRVNINAKQLHDFFLFSEIWLPADIRQSTKSSPVATTMESSQIFGVQRYQQMAAASAFPWNASVAIDSLDIRVDLGQSLGKIALSVTEFWVSSKKSSDFQQSLCLGFKKIAIESSGRLSGFIELQTFRLQTSIHWPVRSANETPLIEASLGFGDLRVKAAFEYQMFLVADLSSLDFLMYNVRDASNTKADRLVCTVEGDKVHLYCTTQSASQVLGLYQAVQRLVQEKQTAYEQSLRDVERYLRRKSTPNQAALTPSSGEAMEEESNDRTPIKLQTNVVVSLKAVKVGAYPSTFFDSQIFKLEALDASAKFSVSLQNNQIESGLGLQLGQVRIALSSNSTKLERKTLEELSVEQVVNYSAGSRGGTILKVPRVLATMQSYQRLQSTQIDYIFKSSFEGKVEVGWNYSRISFIRGMWEKHSRTLAHRLGKPLPQSAVRITGGPRPEPGDQERQADTKREQEKITAVVNVPLSKYSYTALEPPIIVTPQLRDMGEATPPLEWIGLHRDRLPNLTHQVIIVPLLEVAKEVEDAYSKILGS
ncbi:MAG: hypothetical protein MMC23_004579 [Stictis urceolatum]|nr:hypothetical protein [Stictis urceolata]